MASYVGKYEVGERIGGGGMAEVFRGRALGEAGFARQVAIKRVLPHLSEDQKFAELFENEARLASRLNHPNIVSVMNFAKDAEGRLLLVMELVDGVDLFQLMNTGAIPLPAGVHVVGEILRALAYAHARTSGGKPLGIVHRDISPPNVLLSWDGAVKVSDFGIAKAVAVSDNTNSGIIKGKIGYLSPEQARAEPLDQRSDLYSAGIILHELLTNEPLFGGQSDLEVVQKMARHQIPPPSSINPEVPPALDAVALKLLAKNRDERFPNAEAALAALAETGTVPLLGESALGKLLTERFPGRGNQDSSLHGISSVGVAAASAAPRKPAMVFEAQGFEQALSMLPDNTPPRPPQAARLEAPTDPAPKSSGPHADALRTSGPHADALRTSGPHADALRTSGPHADALRTSGPHADALRTSGPHADALRTSGPHADALRSSGPHGDALKPPRGATIVMPTGPDAADETLRDGNAEPSPTGPSPPAAGERTVALEQPPIWARSPPAARRKPVIEARKPAVERASEKPRAGVGALAEPVAADGGPPSSIPMSAGGPAASGGSRTVMIAAVLGAVAFASAAAAFALTRRPPPPPPPRVAPAVLPFLLRLDIAPPEAVVELDGAPAGKGPVFLRTVHPDGKEHTLRISAEGYAPATLVYTDKSPAPAVNLEKLVVEPPDAGVVARPPRREEAPRPKKTKVKVSPSGAPILPP